MARIESHLPHSYYASLGGRKIVPFHPGLNDVADDDLPELERHKGFKARQDLGKLVLHTEKSIVVL